MFEKLKANILFDKLLKRPDICKAYAMVGAEDPWFNTITKVHASLKEIRELPHSIVQIESLDGLKLKGVYYPCDSGCGATVIFVHGYTSHAEREWAYPGLYYHALGFNVLIPYQRAHGPSEGKYISLGALEHLDVMAWVEMINEMNPNDRIVIHGLSMGGGIVLDLSDKVMKNVKCLIADAPSASVEKTFRDVIGHVFKAKQEVIFDHVAERFWSEFHADAEAFDRLKTVSNSRYPLLLSAGSEECLEELFRKISSNNPKDTQIVILPGCNHGNGMYKQRDMYQSAIKGFVDKYIGR